MCVCVSLSFVFWRRFVEEENYHYRRLCLGCYDLVNFDSLSMKQHHLTTYRRSASSSLQSWCVFIGKLHRTRNTAIIDATAIYRRVLQPQFDGEGKKPRPLLPGLDWMRLIKCTENTYTNTNMNWHNKPTERLVIKIALRETSLKTMFILRWYIFFMRLKSTLSLSLTT